MSVAEQIRTIAAEARQASFAMAKLSSSAKDGLLLDMAQALIDNMIQQGAQVTADEQQVLVRYFTR